MKRQPGESLSSDLSLSLESNSNAGFYSAILIEQIPRARHSVVSVRYKDG